MDFTETGMNCLGCHYRHQENGNCTAVGGFCTAVPAAHCPLIPELLARAEAEEARVHELETAYRIEKCEDGPECAELGKARRALAAAEARAEKAETQLREAKHCIAGLSMLIKAVDGKMVMETVLPMARNRLEKYKGKYPSATVVLDMKKEIEYGGSEKQHDTAGVSG